MRLLVLVALAALLSSSALAIPPSAPGAPSPHSKWARYATPRALMWGHEHTVTTGTTYVTLEAGAASPTNHAQIFQWGALVRVCCTAAAVFAWSQDWDDVTLATTGMMVDSGGPDGVGAAFRIEAGTCFDTVPMIQQFQAAGRIARRYGTCAHPTNVSFSTHGYPCEDNADCVDGAVTCSAAGDRGAGGKGAFLLATAAASTTCFVTGEQ